MLRQRKQKYRIKNCEVCGKAFRAARYHARTCSPKCRTALSRAGQKSADLGYSGVTLHQLEMLAVKHGS